MSNATRNAAALAACMDLLELSDVRFKICDGGRGNLGEASRYHAAIKQGRPIVRAFNGRKVYTEEELQKIGARLAAALGLKRDKEHKDRWHTAFGTKTGLGLILTLHRICDEIEDGNADRDLLGGYQG
jgi:hypothetical protein